MRDAIERVEKQPDFVGPHGRAWFGDIEKRYELAKKDRSEGADVAIFIVEAPWAHPVWHSYAIFMIHLRGAIDGIPPTIHLDGATHEFLLYALDPEHPREQFISGGQFPKILTPANFGAQFIAENDAEALKRMEQTVQMICDGKLSPDTDFRQSWIQMFGDNMMKK